MTKRCERSAWIPVDGGAAEGVASYPSGASSQRIAIVPRTSPIRFALVTPRSRVGACTLASSRCRVSRTSRPEMPTGSSGAIVRDDGAGERGEAGRKQRAADRIVRVHDGRRACGAGAGAERDESRRCGRRAGARQRRGRGRARPWPAVRLTLLGLTVLHGCVRPLTLMFHHRAAATSSHPPTTSNSSNPGRSRSGTKTGRDAPEQRCQRRQHDQARNELDGLVLHAA